MKTKCKKCSSTDICIIKSEHGIEYFCSPHMDGNYANKIMGSIFHSEECITKTIDSVSQEFLGLLKDESN